MAVDKRTTTRNNNHRSLQPTADAEITRLRVRLNKKREYIAILELEQVGKPINDLIVSEEYREEGKRISQRVIHGERIEIDTKRKRKDGTLVDVSILGLDIYKKYCADRHEWVKIQVESFVKFIKHE